MEDKPRSNDSWLDIICPQGDIWQQLGTFLVVTLEQGERCGEMAGVCYDI